MNVLVTGGAGYIGSITVDALRRSGHAPVVLDNLVYGHRAAVDTSVPFYEGDVGDKDLVAKIIAEQSVDSCIHFAAFAYVGESVEEPAKYFENNTVQTIGLLKALLAAGVRKFVFSSTCATYGEPQTIPISEDHPQSPINPYGWSKFMVERVLDSFDKAYQLRFVGLRYFNAAGATETLGEHHDPETHLIPNVLRAANGELPCVTVFGDDYPTPDGTCIRDYIHVSDLADAHIRALEHLDHDRNSSYFNLGNGRGFSVMEVIDAARQVTGRKIETDIQPRRPGDPPSLIAEASRARDVLGWQPKHASIDSIVESAWNWKLKFPNGYLK